MRDVKIAIKQKLIDRLDIACTPPISLRIQTELYTHPQPITLDIRYGVEGHLTEDTCET